MCCRSQNFNETASFLLHFSDLTDLACFSRSATSRDVIVLPYGRVQTAQTCWVCAAARALRGKMAAYFLLIFVKLPQYYAEVLRPLPIPHRKRWGYCCLSWWIKRHRFILHCRTGRCFQVFVRGGWKDGPIEVAIFVPQAELHRMKISG
jgi:hypothetical protein